MPLRHFNFWIFDMDGTLTMPIHDFDDIRSELGITPSSSILEAIEKMPASHAARITQKLHTLEMRLAREAQPQPGVKDILTRLTDAGKRLGILTRNGRDIAHATLSTVGLSPFFDNDSVVSRDDCAPKPKPDGVHLLLEHWNAPKEETVIVGDFLYDVQAGFEAGIQTVHFDSSGRFQWPHFTHHKITEFRELNSMI